MTGIVNLTTKKGVIDFYDYTLEKGVIWTEDDKGYDFEGYCFRGLIVPGRQVSISLNSKDEVVYVFEIPKGESDE